MDLVTITGEILHGKLLFLCSVLYMVLRGYVVKVKVSVDNFKDLRKFPFSKFFLKKKKKKKKIEQENSMLFMVSILLVVSLIDKLIKLQWLEMKFGLLPSRTIVSFALMKYL